MLARGMVIALDYFNLPPRNNAPPRRDGKAIAKRAIDWAERWVRDLCGPFPWLPASFDHD